MSWQFALPLAQAADVGLDESLSAPVKLLIAVAIFLVSFGAGVALARALRLPDYGWKIGVILFAIVAGTLVLVTGWPPKRGIDLSGGVILIYEVDPEKKAPGEDVDMDKLIASVARRINPGGTKEITVRRYGEEQIEIVVPEVDEDEVRRLEEKVSRIGALEFRILANRFDDEALIETALELAPSVKQVRAPDGTVRARWLEVEQKPETIQQFQNMEGIATRINNEGRLEVLVKMDRFNVTGEYLTRTAVGEKLGQPVVEFGFNAEGAARFGGITGQNLPVRTPTGREHFRQLAIILDNYLISAPRINSVITDQGIIEGNFKREEVQDLVAVLEAGQLPAALRKEPSTRLHTGPTLGSDTIEQGKRATIASVIVVALFMIGYYRFAGVVASLAVVLNLILTVAMMMLIKAAFTLTGIAGLALTLGMAVDANVLIYERMREEFAKGATLRMAIRNGFSRATTTIIDSNLTTLITAVVLYAVGSDQIKGFAVTLFLGLVASLFTAVFCARIVMEIWEKKRWLKRLKMMQFIGETHFDFLGKWPLATAFSLALIAVGVGAVVARGKNMLDIDFTGGTSIQVLFNEPQDIADVRRTLTDLPAEVREAAREQIAATMGEEIRQEVQAEAGEELSPAELQRRADERIEELAALPDVAVSSVALLNEEQGRRFIVNTSNLNIHAVETILHLTFGEKLAHNELQVEAVAEIPPRAEGEADAAEAPADPYAGGTRARLEFSEKVTHERLEERFRAALERTGQSAPFALEAPGYVEGSTAGFPEWNVRIALEPDQARQVFQAIEDEVEEAPVFPASTNIGGKVAGNTRVQAIYALLASLVLIVGYIWLRFEKVVFGLAAVVALLHDVLITLGFVALSYFLAPFLGVLLIDPFKIDLTIVAALLTIVGYSLNDTIVVFDRIREVRGKSPDLTAGMLNLSVNQTLGRTILTGLTTLFVLLILYVWGGQGIHGFAYCLLIGVIVGTYSSIYVAAPILLLLMGPARPAGQPQKAGAAVPRSEEFARPLEPHENT